MVLLNCVMLHSIHNREDFISNEIKVIEKKAPFDRNELPRNIRVLLHTTDFKSIFHQQIEIELEGTYKITKNTLTKDISTKNIFKKDVSTEDAFVEDSPAKNNHGKEILTKKNADCKITENEFKMKTGDIVRVEPLEDTNRVLLASINRNCKNKHPRYRGILEVRKTEEGYLLINELPVESYLYGVISSEMPSYYPMEALKAQAVCARTYAYQSICDRRIAEYYADVDDSTSFQVYQNVDETGTTSKAVQDTRGEVLIENKALADTSYYSTSCGLGNDGPISRKHPISNAVSNRFHSGYANEKAFKKWIDRKYDEDYEKEEPWYRWSGKIDLHDEEKMRLLSEKIAERYEKVPDAFMNISNVDGLKDREPIGRIDKITVQERMKNGMINKLYIEGDNYSLILCGEYNIRYVLGDEEMKLVNQDGTVVRNMNLLPSAYFYIVPNGHEDYTVRGGGYGHGRGMSQNAAKKMAEEKKSYREILKFFYKNASIAGPNP